MKTELRSGRVCSITACDLAHSELNYSDFYRNASLSTPLKILLQRVSLSMTFLFSIDTHFGKRVGDTLGACGVVVALPATEESFRRTIPFGTTCSGECTLGLGVPERPAWQPSRCTPSPSLHCTQPELLFGMISIHRIHRSPLCPQQFTVQFFFCAAGRKKEDVDLCRDLINSFGARGQDYTVFGQHVGNPKNCRSGTYEIVPVWTVVKDMLTLHLELSTKRTISNGIFITNSHHFTVTLHTTLVTRKRHQTTARPSTHK